jgi:hypothetical protein
LPFVECAFLSGGPALQARGVDNQQIEAPFAVLFAGLDWLWSGPQDIRAEKSFYRIEVPCLT